MAVPVITTPLGDQVYDAILSRILGGTYAPGERLFPDQLRVEFGVSITPVRDALQRLRQVGFVEVRAREGVYVATVDAKRARDTYDMRIALETLAARLSVSRIPDEVLADIARRFEVAEEALIRTDDEQVLLETDWSVHEMMARYSDNDLLRASLATVVQQGNWVGLVAGQLARFYRQAFEDHKVILDALIRRDTEGAVLATQRHLERAKTIVLRHLAAPSASSPGAADS